MWFTKETVYDTAGTDVIELAAGFALEDITFWRDGTNSTTARSMVLELGGANKITISDQFVGSSTRVETLRFSDTSTVTLTGVVVTTHGSSGNDSIAGISGGASLNDIIYGYAGNDTIIGYDGDDTIYGGDGNDTLEGRNNNDWLDGGAGDDTLEGGTGNDTYVYSSGLDTLYDTGGTDKLIITGGATINDLTTSQTGSHAKIVLDTGVDEIQINYQHSSSTYHIETIQFDDGFVTSLTNHLSWTWGTSGADTLTGTSGNDTIIGKDGNDTLSGAAGADNIHGGAGDDTLYGGDSSDLLHGGLGDDILFGDAGADTIFGGAGADTFMFEAATAYSGIDIIKDFTANDNDVIDITDVLDGIYDPMTDDLADFVQLSTSGSDTLLSIDRDGTGSTYGWTQIAMLQGVTGITDPDALVLSGNLLVA